MDSDDAERVSGGPEHHSGFGSAVGPDTDIADKALDAMTRAVASLRDQAARMINATPPTPSRTLPAQPSQDPPGET